MPAARRPSPASTSGAFTRRGAASAVCARCRAPSLAWIGSLRATAAAVFLTQGRRRLLARVVRRSWLLERHCRCDAGPRLVAAALAAPLDGQGQPRRGVRRSTAATPSPSADRAQLEFDADSDIRIIGIFDDRDDHRSPPIGRRLSASSATIAELVDFARTLADRSPRSSPCRSPPRSACCRGVQAALGAAGRHQAAGPYPASCGSGPAPIPMSAPSPMLDLARQADRRLGLGGQAGFDNVFGRLGAGLRSRRSCSRRRRRHQARQPRAGAVPPEALRLQQRADRGLQVPLDVYRPAAMPTR